MAGQNRWSGQWPWKIKKILNDLRRLGGGLRTWDQWEWNDCDKRFGDDWPGRIPAQLIAHVLFYFSKQKDLIFDPMAGGGVTPDTCLALNRRCWAFDITDRPETRPEIEPHTWTISSAKKLKSSTAKRLPWPVSSKEKPDLIIFDPSYFDKKPPTMTKTAYPACRKKNILNSLRSFSPFLNKMQKRQQDLPSSTRTGLRLVEPTPRRA